MINRPIQTIGSFERDRVLRRGLRLLDRAVLYGFQSRKRQLKLNRVQYEFHNLERPLSDAQEVKLEGLKNQKLSVHIGLICNPLRPGDEADQRYYFKCLAQTPVVHNGNLCFAGYLERGDRLEIGYNYLDFKAITDRSCSSLWPHDVSCLLERECLYDPNVSIYLSGETGVGKSKLAREIHTKNKDLGNFVHLNLAALSSGLIESELFGHVKGAFTGADAYKLGAFLEANNGSLFLDEIDSISADIQAKLLLFLDDRNFRQVGGARMRKTNAKLFFASGQPLEDLVAQKKFRKDLYYRIRSGLEIHLPRLNGDRLRIADLCQYYCQQKGLSIQQNLLEYYQSMEWPGNIRQLFSHLDKKRLLTKGNRLRFSSLDHQLMIHPETFREFYDGGAFIKMKPFKRRYIQLVYRSVNQNVEASSRILGVSPNTVRRSVNPR